MCIKKKKELTICPHCDNDLCRIEDYEFDVDSLWIKVYCPECDKSWSEWALLQYDGYSADGVLYDKNGDVIDD